MALLPFLEIQLPSGESVSVETIVQGFLLLARENFPLPITNQMQAHLACVTLVSEIMTYNEAQEII